MDKFPGGIYEASYNVVKNHGAFEERKAIIKWLRNEKSWTTRVLDRVADAIERGEPLEADDE